ncbi:MAG: PEP-CTERM sorting domain-containing protein [Verrucomicrobiales bacterium]
MKLRFQISTLTIAAVAIAAAPKAEAVLAAYVHIVKNETPDTRFHLSEVEAFADGVVPNGLGGATFDGQSTSTNDIGDGSLVAFGVGNNLPTIGTTNMLEHGLAAQNPNNVLENVGNVWSTANNLATNAQYTLDLGGTSDVTTIRLWPRADGCCAFRWSNLEIQLLDSDRNPIPGTLNTHSGDANVALEYTFAAVPEPSGVALLGLAASALLFRRRR